MRSSSYDRRGHTASDGKLFYIISKGARFTGMPAWGGEDGFEPVRGPVALIRVLPKLSPEEIKLMRHTAAGAGEHRDSEVGGSGMKEMQGMEGIQDEGKSKAEGKVAGQGGDGGRKSVKPHSH